MLETEGMLYPANDVSYIYLIQNSPAVKKVCGPKKAIVRKDGGGQEMAVMVG